MSAATSSVSKSEPNFKLTGKLPELGHRLGAEDAADLLETFPSRLVSSVGWQLKKNVNKIKVIKRKLSPYSLHHLSGI